MIPADQQLTVGHLCGCGSPHDVDAIGWDLVRAVSARLPHTITTHQLAHPADMLHLPPAQCWWLVDALLTPRDMPSKTLDVRPWKNTTDLASLATATSSHGWSLLESLKLAEKLGRLPRATHLILAPIPATWQQRDLRCLAKVRPYWEWQLLEVVVRQAELLLRDGEVDTPFDEGSPCTSGGIGQDSSRHADDRVVRTDIPRD